MKTSSIVWTVIILLVIIGAGWYYIAGMPAAPASSPAEQTQTSGNAPGAVAQNAAPMQVSVTYGPNGFSPSTVTVAKGGTVTWTAAPGADEMWVASNPHPIHSGYDGTTLSQHCAVGYSGPAPLDQCSSGTTFSFTFNQTGTWGYHNHGNHSDTGTVVVQ